MLTLIDCLEFLKRDLLIAPKVGVAMGRDGWGSTRLQSAPSQAMPLTVASKDDFLTHQVKDPFVSHGVIKRHGCTGVFGYLIETSSEYPIGECR